MLQESDENDTDVPPEVFRAQLVPEQKAHTSGRQDRKTVLPFGHDVYAVGECGLRAVSIDYDEPEDRRGLERDGGHLPLTDYFK